MATASSASTTIAPPRQPFRFLGLPAELRIIYYQSIDVEIQRHAIQRDFSSYWWGAWKVEDEPDKPSITLVLKSLPVTIISTCHQIYHEAIHVLAQKLRELQRIPVRFELNYADAALLTTPYGPFAACFYTSGCIGLEMGDPNIRDLATRCSKFLAHTREVPAEETDHVEFVILAREPLRARTSTTYGGEVKLALVGAERIAIRTGMAMKFTIFEGFPDFRLSFPTANISSGILPGSRVVWVMQERHGMMSGAREHPGRLRFQIVKSVKYWAQCLRWVE
jgi:hypothetical protein